MRTFGSADRAALFDMANGMCQICGCELNDSFHADHVVPFALGGKTTLANAQALCPTCNTRKGKKMDFKKYFKIADRKWQRECLVKAFGVFQEGRNKFLIAAAPGAGKTRAASAISRLLLDMDMIDQVIVIAPRSKIAEQWMDIFNLVDMATFDLDAMRSLRPTSPATNIVTTYQGLGMNAERIGQHVSSRRTLVIMDELHHAAHGASWGESAVSSFESATFVLKLTGTPFRSDDNKIIWLDYAADGNEAVIDEDQSYILGYGQAVEAGYCRAVAFDRWSPAGGVTLVDRDGEEESFDSMDEMDVKSRKVALSTMMGWIENEEEDYSFLHSYLLAAVETLKEVKTHAPDAGGLVVAANIKHAKLIANMLAKMTGEEATIVHSEMPSASKVIDKFAIGYGGSWLVSVNMVSEGTDVPRLRVLAFASRVRSMLYFRQVMGRIVRKQVASSQGDDARCLIVDVAPWNQYAEEIEIEIGYRLGKRIHGEEPNNPAGKEQYTEDEQGTAEILQGMINAGCEDSNAAQGADAGGADPAANPAEVNSSTFIIGDGERQSGVFRGETLSDYQLAEGQIIRNSRIANAKTDAARSLVRSISPHGWYLIEQSRYKD